MGKQVFQKMLTWLNIIFCTGVLKAEKQVTIIQDVSFCAMFSAESGCSLRSTWRIWFCATVTAQELILRYGHCAEADSALRSTWWICFCTTVKVQDLMLYCTVKKATADAVLYSGWRILQLLGVEICISTHLNLLQGRGRGLERLKGGHFDSKQHGIHKRHQIQMYTLTFLCEKSPQTTFLW
jgi:hypothetical protein